MKFTIAYYLCLIYTTVMFQPLIPLVEDAFAHTFAEAYHIATVHARYGNNHLEKDLANTSEGANKNQTSLKQDEAFTVHIPTMQMHKEFITRPFKRSYPNSETLKLPASFTQVLAPPPKNSLS
jgi:hypothetical protein